MNIYFDRDSKSVSVAIHIQKGWIHFQLHKLWALAWCGKPVPRAIFIGPLLIVWCLDG